MDRRTLSSQGLEVSAEGLGCMGMTWAYGPGDEGSGRATIDRVLELGITFLDTAEVYGPHTNPGARRAGDCRPSRTVRDRHEVRVRDRSRIAERPWPPTEPRERRACEGSLKRLGIDTISSPTG
jgi:aryl-alcohol dehydrogenase-like predicted oxidoreductase